MSLLLLLLPALAQAGAEIHCEVKNAFGKVGTKLEIEYFEEGGYRALQTDALRPHSPYAVTVEATRPDPGACELDITKKVDGTHAFYIRQESGSWKLILPKDQGTMKCKVAESLRLSRCEPGKNP